MSLSRWWRSMRYGKPVLVVSGLPRSGTSMAMKMLDAAGFGVVTDGERGADIDNPKGYYEDERVKDLEGMQDKSWVRDARGRAVKVISFLLKDLPRDNNYRVVFMKRELEEVLASQQKMLERRGESNDSEDAHMKDVYENHLWRVHYMLKNDSAFEWLEVSYRDMLADPASEAKRLADFLGCPEKARSMAEVVDPDLYRNRAAS